MCNQKIYGIPFPTWMCFKTSCYLIVKTIPCLSCRNYSTDKWANQHDIIPQKNCQFQFNFLLTFFFFFFSHIIKMSVSLTIRKRYCLSHYNAKCCWKMLDCGICVVPSLTWSTHPTFLHLKFFKFTNLSFGKGIICFFPI